MIAGSEGHVGEAALEMDGEGDGVCGEQWGEGCCDDAEEAEDGDDEVAFPEGPVLLQRSC